MLAREKEELSAHWRMATLNQNQPNTEQLPKRAATEKNQIEGAENKDDMVASELSTCRSEDLEQGRTKIGSGWQGRPTTTMSKVAARPNPRSEATTGKARTKPGNQSW
jgi:hypothetical protein